MIYDYKSDEVVQDTILECFCHLIEDIEDEYYTLHRYENLSIYAPSYIAREIIARMLEEIEDVWVHAESENELLYSDDNDVVITIASDGMIFVETARYENGQLKNNDDCSLTYVYDGFNKKDVDALSANDESILIFGFEDETKCDDYDYESDEDDDEYTIDGEPATKEEFDEYVKKFKGEDKASDNDNSDDEDDDIHGFTVSKTDDNGYVSYSYYSSNGFSKNDVKDIFDLLGYKLED